MKALLKCNEILERGFSEVDNLKSLAILVVDGIIIKFTDRLLFLTGANIHLTRLRDVSFNEDTDLKKSYCVNIEGSIMQLLVYNNISLQKKPGMGKVINLEKQENNL